METSRQKPLLSICIPTYNRYKNLEKCLESIVVQKEFQLGKVEVVISDNSSEDRTQEMVLEFKKKYPNIIYSVNEKNIRDENFPRVLSLANGKLRKLCNDTLVFSDGSLEEMCKVVQRYESGCPYVFWGNGELAIEDNMCEKRFRDFVLTSKFYITSIATFSIWDFECDDIANDISGVEFKLWQVRKALSLASQKDCVVIHNIKLTTLQAIEKKNVSYGLFKVFYFNYFSLLQPYFESGVLKNEDRDCLERTLLFDFFMNWCLKWEKASRGMQFSQEENLKKAIENQYRGKPYWLKYRMVYELKMMKFKIKNIFKARNVECENGK